jgi:hypothetical protein
MVWLATPNPAGFNSVAMTKQTKNYFLLFLHNLKNVFILVALFIKT